jgi:hypothetical protein
MSYRIKMAAVGMAVLLAAGTERDWLDAWSAQAIRLSRIRYEQDQGSA